MATTRETLLAWLRDAHAMEKQAIEMLENQASRIENYPEMKQKVQSHLETSRRQAERVEECIRRLDGDTSTIKEGMAKFMGNVSALTNAAASDEVVKNGIASYAFEHFEIASYRALIGTAEALGETHIQQVCEEILREEEAMADWLETNLPEVTQRYLQREVTGEQAKR